MRYRVMLFDVTSTKTTKITKKFNQNKNKAGLILNPNRETKQTRTRTQHVRKKNPTRFYCKEETKTKEGYDKKHTQN
jgi:hypothetical protein